MPVVDQAIGGGKVQFWWPAVKTPLVGTPLVATPLVGGGRERWALRPADDRPRALARNSGVLNVRDERRHSCIVLRVVDRRLRDGRA
jgi:hypothetical protein